MKNVCHDLYNHACLYNNNFMHLSDADQLIFTNENMCYYYAKICDEILMRRNHIFYMKSFTYVHIIVYIL